MDFFKKNYKALVLLFTILLDIFGFIGVISPELEILDKIIAWIVFAYFFYALSMSKMFFGRKYRFIDIILLFAYFNLVLKNFIIFFNETLPTLTSPTIIKLVTWFVSHGALLQVVTFNIGAILIIFISYYTARRVGYTKESIFSKIVHDKTFDENYIGTKPPSTAKKAVFSFFLYNAFFLIVFNLLVEWLGFIEDDLITIISIVVLLILLKRFSGNIKAPIIIEKITNVADDFYGDIISSIESKRYLMLLCTGLLSLQMLTDFFIFVSPILLGKTEVSYFTGLQDHITFLQAMFQDIAASPATLVKFEIFTAYILEGIFIVFLIVMPLYIWYLTYTEKKEHIPTPLLVLFFMSLASFALKPLVRFKSLEYYSGGQYSVFGIDIIIKNLMESLQSPIVYLLLISLLSGALSYALYKLFQKFTLFIFTAVNYIFILTYVYFFMEGTINYYYQEIMDLQKLGHWLIALYFYMFAVIIVLFYFVALVSFIREINSEFEFITFQQATEEIRREQGRSHSVYILIIVFLLSAFIGVLMLRGNFPINFILGNLILLALSGFAVLSVSFKLHYREL